MMNINGLTNVEDVRRAFQAQRNKKASEFFGKLAELCEDRSEGKAVSREEVEQLFGDKQVQKFAGAAVCGSVNLLSSTCTTSTGRGGVFVWDKHETAQKSKDMAVMLKLDGASTVYAVTMPTIQTENADTFNSLTCVACSMICEIMEVLYE